MVIKMNKYHNKKIGTFDSRKELNRFHQLQLLQRAGEITNLQRQVAFELLPSQKGADGKTIERPVKYIADFTYNDKNGKLIVEDVKSPITRTAEYVIKRKLMLFIHNIRINEIYLNANIY